jgi:hypothetical protein
VNQADSIARFVVYDEAYTDRENVLARKEVIFIKIHATIVIRESKKVLELRYSEGA